MNRVLPIFLLVFGLVLTFTSLATAKSPDMVDFGDDVVCLEETVSTAQAVPLTQDKRFLRCWKKIQLGMVVAPCPMDPGLDVVTVAATPKPAADLIQDAPFTAYESILRTLVLPPPKA